MESAGASDPSLVAQAVAAAVGVKEAPGESTEEALHQFFDRRRLLLVLDNCEHLIEACARLSTLLLARSTDLKIVATSREPLGIAGEQVYRVPSLALPDFDGPLTPRSVEQCELVRLFVERAAFQQHAFAVTDHNAAALVSICRRLDGIPLAIDEESWRASGRCCWSRR